MVSLVARRARMRAYVVSYRLKLAELRYGQIVTTYFAPCSRRFLSNELNVILADIYTEVGPAAHLLGIEILSVIPAYSLPFTR